MVKTRKGTTGIMLSNIYLYASLIIISLWLGGKECTSTAIIYVPQGNMAPNFQPTPKGNLLTTKIQVCISGVSTETHRSAQ